jgi:hypothetical protein
MAATTGCEAGVVGLEVGASATASHRKQRSEIAIASWTERNINGSLGQ